MVAEVEDLQLTDLRAILVLRLKEEHSRSVIQTRRREEKAFSVSVAFKVG